MLHFSELKPLAEESSLFRIVEATGVGPALVLGPRPSAIPLGDTSIKTTESVASKIRTIYLFVIKLIVRIFNCLKWNRRDLNP